MNNPFGALFDRRSITTSYDLLQHLLRGNLSTAGATVNENSAFNVPAVMTCVSLRARALASLPVRVYERLDDRSKRPAVNHPIATVLAKPNGWQSRFELFVMLEAHRVLRGNAFAWKNVVTSFTAPEGFERQVIEVIPMHPDQVEVILPKNLTDPTEYKLHKANGQIVPLPTNEVIHQKGLSTDGRRGRSVLADAREMLGVAIATQEHAASFWSRDATPSVVLEHPKTVGDIGRKNLEESWERIYGHGKDKRRVAVLEEGMTMKQLSLTAQDAQFLETRKFSRGEIAGWFHVPPHMIGDTEKSTSWGTGIEQQQIGFLVFTLRPDLVGWEQRLTLDLIARPDKYFIEFSIDGLMRGDSAARGQFYRVMREIGAYSANDIRAFESLNPIDGGDEYLRPSNLTPLGVPPTGGDGAASVGAGR